MSTLLAPPAVLFPAKSPTGRSEVDTADTSFTSSPPSAATPDHNPIISTVVEARSAVSRDIPTHTASTQTDNNLLSRVTGPAASRTSNTNYMQGRAEEPARVNDSDSTLPRTKQGAATHYLHRAEGYELPGHGNVSLANPEAAGVGVASLTHTSAKPVEIRKSDLISAARAAASIAHANSRKVEQRKPNPGSGAEQAASYVLGDRNDRAMQTSPVGPSSTTSSNQHRAGAKISGNALTAASIAHMPTVRLASNAVEPAFERLIENDLNNACGVSQQERCKSDILRAATISMAKSNRGIHSHDSGVRRHRLLAPGQPRPATAPPSSCCPTYSPDFEDATHKTATERLALIGYDSGRSVSLLGAQDVRASLSRTPLVTAESTSANDRGRTGGNDRSPFRSHGNPPKIENKKHGEKAVLLMTAAQRNVQAQMSGLDRQVADSKVARRKDWETRPREVDQAGRSERQQQQNQGKVSIGGGGHMSQEEIDAIAERNVRPVLDDMNRKAKVERARVSAEKAREAEERMESEEKKRLQEVQRVQEEETQEEIKRARGLEKGKDKRRKKEEKRRRKEGRKFFKVDSKRAAKGNQALPSMASENDQIPALTPPTSPREEKGLRGLVNKFRLRKYSRTPTPATLVSKEFSSTGGTVTATNDPTQLAPLAPAHAQTNGGSGAHTLTTPNEVSLLNAPPILLRQMQPVSPVLSPDSFQCRGKTDKEEEQDTRHYSEEERDTFSRAGAPVVVVVLNRPEQLDGEAGTEGNGSSVGSKFFENL